MRPMTVKSKITSDPLEAADTLEHEQVHVGISSAGYTRAEMEHEEARVVDGDTHTGILAAGSQVATLLTPSA
jgi:hypothetical protein